MIRSLIASVSRRLAPTSQAVAAAPALRHVSRTRPWETPRLDPVERLGLSAAPLREARFCVLDFETTGTRPSHGDEIVQIGAVRIADGRVVAEDRFETLVDPRRSIPKRSERVHGITPEMVRGQPRIAAVLPALRDFAGDDVIVAYNAAFDMACLKAKEAETGVVFANPVLDALMLAVHLDPQADDHALSAVAARHGVSNEGRHTALGDALITAKLFVAMFDGLEAKGLTTLGRAHAVSSRMMKRRERALRF